MSPNFTSLLGVSGPTTTKTPNTHSGDFSTAGNNHCIASSNLGITNAPYSMGAWIKIATPPSSGGNARYLIEKASNGGNFHDDAVIRYENPSGTLRLAFNISDGFGGATSNYNVDLGTSNWHRVWTVITASGTTVTVTGYLDGAQVGTPASFTAAGGGFDPGNFFQLGGANTNQTNFCLHDEVQVFNTNVGATYITNDWNTPAVISPSASGLQAYYQFENDVTSDSTANAYNMTKTGVVNQSTDTPFA